MKKTEVKNRLQGALIAVIRSADFDTAKAVCKAVLDAGVDALEITFSVKDAPKLILELKNELPNAIIGAGTVLNQEQAKDALESGADFIVSPCIVPEVGEFCFTNNIFCSMGAATPTEAYEAYRLGCEVVKLFPGECISPKIIKACKAPMPFLEFMPTGGVDDTTIANWFNAGAYAVGLGGYLTKGIDKSNLSLIKQRVDRLKAAKGESV